MGEEILRLQNQTIHGERVGIRRENVRDAMASFTFESKPSQKIYGTTLKDADKR